MEERGSSERGVLDAVLTGVVAVVLVLAGAWGVLAVGMVNRAGQMLAELGAELPTLTRLARGLVRVPVIPALLLVILLGGFAWLFVVKDRPRALLGALAAAVAVGFVGMLLGASIAIVMTRVVESMGSM